MPLASAHSSEATTSAPAPSLTPGALPAVWVPSFMKIGGSLASDSSVASRRGDSSCSTTVSPFLPLIVTGTISSSRRPSSVAAIDALVAAQRPLVHVGAGHLELGGDLGGLLGHVLAAERVGEPVVDHRVDRLAVAHAEAEARLGQHVGGVGHGLHAAADADLEVAGADRLVEHPDRADARRADLVDGLRGDLLGDAALDLRPGGDGIWPWPAWRTVPITTWSTSPPSTPARSSAALMAMPPSSVAFSEESPPPSFPTGVRAALRITVLGMARNGS